MVKIRVKISFIAFVFKLRLTTDLTSSMDQDGLHIGCGTIVFKSNLNPSAFPDSNPTAYCIDNDPS